MIKIADNIFDDFVRGRESAFDVIFTKYYRTLVLFSMKHGLELTESEDIVMDIFHKVWQRRDKIRSAAALNTLLFTFTYNRTLNVLRNIKTRNSINLKLEKNDSDEGFEHFIIEEEMLVILDKAIEGLPSQCREVILLYLSGKSVSEIAEVLNLSVNTIKTHRTRAIINLRKTMEEESTPRSRYVMNRLIVMLLLIH